MQGLFAHFPPPPSTPPAGGLLVGRHGWNLCWRWAWSRRGARELGMDWLQRAAFILILNLFLHLYHLSFEKPPANAQIATRLFYPDFQVFIGRQTVRFRVTLRDKSVLSGVDLQCWFIGSVPGSLYSHSDMNLLLLWYSVLLCLMFASSVIIIYTAITHLQRNTYLVSGIKCRNTA